MSKIATIRSRHLRRRILDTLRAAASAGGEGWLAARTLLKFLSDEIDALTRSELDDEVRYLAGTSKGYAETRDTKERLGDLPQIQAKITPKGVDLVEGSIAADPGVEDDRA